MVTVGVETHMRGKFDPAYKMFSSASFADPRKEGVTEQIPHLSYNPRDCALELHS